MLELIKGFVSRCVPPEEIRKSNAEILVISRAGWGGRKSIINSYPAASKTLRGSGGDILFLEEAAFMPGKFNYYYLYYTIHRLTYIFNTLP
jgi:hypothetical protein